MREKFQALVHAVDSSAHSFRHAAVPLPLLRQKVPPEVRHEETHLYPHRYVERRKTEDRPNLAVLFVGTVKKKNLSAKKYLFLS